MCLLWKSCSSCWKLISYKEWCKCRVLFWFVRLMQLDFFAGAVVYLFLSTSSYNWCIKNILTTYKQSPVLATIALNWQYEAYSRFLRTRVAWIKRNLKNICLEMNQINCLGIQLKSSDRIYFIYLLPGSTALGLPFL